MNDGTPTEVTDEDITVTETSDSTETSEVADDTDTEAETPAEETEADTEETFPRSYVERLRRESAGYRERATKGDTYAQRLHTELVRATGKLADPTDLPFDEAHLDNRDALTAAVNDLLDRKPHLASRRPTGDIGQGVVSGRGSNVDLAAILRGKAG
ncbi:hypothetical protein ACEWX3_04630 [Mycobacterium sp. G7A2]|uniref:hypothetical protein n=1 Tax=Mycobacterium sp. G7A2 TaxID=3317307 RepID=UPI0035A98BBF